jgi:hypothetical protein
MSGGRRVTANAPMVVSQTEGMALGMAGETWDNRAAVVWEGAMEGSLLKGKGMGMAGDSKALTGHLPCCPAGTVGMTGMVTAGEHLGMGMAEIRTPGSLTTAAKGMAGRTGGMEVSPTLSTSLLPVIRGGRVMGGTSAATVVAGCSLLDPPAT